MSAIYILWLRELKRYTRSRAQIIASLGQPMLYLLVLGFGLNPVFKRAGYGSYFQFIAPGVITDRVAKSAATLGISMTAPLGSHNLVAATLLDRFDETLSVRAAA